MADFKFHHDMEIGLKGFFLVALAGPPINLSDHSINFQQFKLNSVEKTNQNVAKVLFRPYL